MNKTYTIIIIFTALLLSSCRKDLTELNKNPNDPVWTDPGLLFKQSIKNGAGSYNSDVNVEQWSLMNWNMFIATRGGISAGDEYTVPSGKDAFWSEQFTSALMNAQQTINLTKDTSSYSNLTNAARIWKVFLFHRITDLWGEIPYSEALKGYSDLIYAPKYDTQKDIYYSMLAELKDAADALDNSKSITNASNDLIFSGNTDKWILFANSLRLRLATHIKQIDPVKYAAEMSDLQTRDLISNNSLSALFPFNMEKKNHFYEAYFSGQAATQNNPSHYFVELLKSNNDPRIEIFLEESQLSAILPWVDKYKGIPNLLVNTSSVWNSFEDDWSDVSGIGNWFLRAETPGVFISYSEVCYLKAEAALAGQWAGNADEFLKDGIRANIAFYEEYGLAEHDISDVAINNYIFSIGTVDLEKIITEKWISFAFENGYEAYTEYRRTGFPVLTDYNNNPINIDIFPNRMPYPSSENSLNNENYSIAVARQGLDNEFTKLWWDVN